MAKPEEPYLIIRTLGKDTKSMFEGRVTITLSAFFKGDEAVHDNVNDEVTPNTRLETLVNVMVWGDGLTTTQALESIN